MRIKTIYIVIVIIIFNAGVANAQTYPETIACWSLDEASGPRVDDSSNNYHLTDNNTVSSALGIINNSALFIRTNSEYFSLSSPITIADNTDYSISAWLRLDDTVSFPVLFSNSTNSSRVFISDAGTTIKFHSLSSTVATWGYSFNTATWYHIFFNVDGTNGDIDLYINGSYIGNRLLADTSQKIDYIGRMVASSSYYHNGLIDEVAIFSDLLTSDQISATYNSGAGISCNSIVSGAISSDPATYTVDLPSGGSGILEMKMNAGEVVTALGIALIVMLLSYDLLSAMAKGSKPK